MNSNRRHTRFANSPLRGRFVFATAVAVFLASFATGLLSLGGGCARQQGDGPNANLELGAGFFADNDAVSDLALAGLLSPDPKRRAQAFQVFQDHWSSAASRVARLTRSESIPKRLAGAYLMAHLGGKAELPVLRQFLQDPAPKVRLLAMHGVVRLQDRESTALLLKLLPEAKYEALVVILHCLLRLDPATAERECHKLVKDERWTRRRGAAQLLGQLGTETSVDALAPLLGDPVWMVQKDAADSVGQRRLRSQRDKLKELLRHAEWQVRAAAAKALGDIGEPADASVVAGVAVGDEDKHARIAAAGVLSQFPSEVVLETIERIVSLPGEDKKVKRAALQSLAKLGGDKAREIFERVLRSENEELRTQARLILEQENSIKKP